MTNNIDPTITPAPAPFAPKGEALTHVKADKHTPLPWRTDPTGRHIQSNELHVASCESSSHDHAAIDRANAALIVRAVNEHHDLRMALEAVARSPQVNCTGESNHPLDCDCVGDRVRAVLSGTPYDCDDERYDCPIHGMGEGPDCPRC